MEVAHSQVAEMDEGSLHSTELARVSTEHKLMLLQRYVARELSNGHGSLARFGPDEQFWDRYEATGEILGRGSFSEVFAARRLVWPQRSSPVSVGADERAANDDDDGDQFTSFEEILATPRESSLDAYYALATRTRDRNISESTVIDEHETEMFAVKTVNAKDVFTRTAALKEVEICLLGRSHPNLINVVDFFFDPVEYRMYIVYPRMYGSLVDVVFCRGQHVSESDARLIIRQVLSALEFLHSKGIAHRDLKPDNILCSFPPSCFLPVRLSDFGLANGSLQLVQSVTMSSSKNHLSVPNVHSTSPKLLTPVGSCEFMSPEVVRSWIDREASPYDKKCDIWSLGVILYILLCGYPPFYGACSNNCEQDSHSLASCAGCQQDLFTRIQCGDFGFPPEEWSTISDGAKDLIRLLLTRDSSLRPSAKQVQHHQWLSLGLTPWRLDNGYVGSSINGLYVVPSSGCAAPLSPLGELSYDNGVNLEGWAQLNLNSPSAKPNGVTDQLHLASCCASPLSSNGSRNYGDGHHTSSNGLASPCNGNGSTRSPQSPTTPGFSRPSSTTNLRHMYDSMNEIQRRLSQISDGFERAQQQQSLLQVAGLHENGHSTPGAPGTPAEGDGGTSPLPDAPPSFAMVRNSCRAAPPDAARCSSATTDHGDASQSDKVQFSIGADDDSTDSEGNF